MEDEWDLSSIAKEKEAGEKLSGPEIWNCAEVSEMLQSHLEYWGNYNFAESRRQEDMATLLKQVLAMWKLQAIKKTYGDQPVFWKGLKGVFKKGCHVLLVKSIPDMREHDNRNILDLPNTGSADLRTQLIAAGMDEDMYSSVCLFPWYPHSTFGMKADGTGNAKMPPPYVARVWMVYLRVAMLILRPKYVLILSADGADVMAQMQLVMEMPQSQLKTYAMGSKDFRGRFVSSTNFNKINPFETMPLPLYRAGSTKLVRVMHPHYLRQVGREPVNKNDPNSKRKEVVQDELLKSIAIESVKVADTERKRVNAFELMGAGKKQKGGSSSSSAGAGGWILTPIPLWKNKLLLCGMPLEESHKADLVVRRGCGMIVNMGSIKVKFPNTKEYRQLRKLEMLPDQFQSPGERWTPEALSSLCTAILEQWKNGKPVAVCCDSGVQENWLVALCMLFTICPHYERLLGRELELHRFLELPEIKELFQHREAPLPYKEELHLKFLQFVRWEVASTLSIFYGESGTVCFPVQVRVVLEDDEVEEDTADTYTVYRHLPLYQFRSYVLAKYFLMHCRTKIEKAYPNCPIYIGQSEEGFYAPSVQHTHAIAPWFQKEYQSPIMGEEQVLELIKTHHQKHSSVLPSVPLLLKWDSDLLQEEHSLASQRLPKEELERILE